MPHSLPPLLLPPHSIQDLSSGNIYDASLALNGLACFATPDLSRDLANDVLALVRACATY